MIDLLITALAVWYVSYALSSTHGPGGVFDWLREHVWHGRRGYDIISKVEADDPVYRKLKHNGLLDCPVCLAFWAALVLLLLPMGVVTQALAVAGAAMILHGWSGWRYNVG
jgi:hypothetical protein